MTAMQEIKGLRPIGCTGIVKPLLAAMLFASRGVRAASPHGLAAVHEEG